MKTTPRQLLWAGVCAGITLNLCNICAEPAAAPENKPPVARKAVEPKPLSESITRGLAWLASKQHADGGWSIASDGPDMNAESRALIETSDVADTCMALLAFLRAGNTLSSGEYAKNFTKGVEFICAEIEASDDESLFITKVRGTKIQQKLGTYIDTFFAAQLLAEIKTAMPDEAGRQRVVQAAKEVLGKMDRHQKVDGTWGGSGWATTLSQTVASKGLNRAVQSGLEVNEVTRTRAENYGKGKYDAKNKSFEGSDAAGVDLYAAAAALSTAQESANANATRKDEITQQMKSASTPEERAGAERELAKFAETDKQVRDVHSTVTDRLQDKKFLAGFGSNGGEEFLSYLSIGESLVLEGGEPWAKWDKAITENLNHVQSPAGWWGGSHCITGGTFCTAAALLVLMVDRMPLPEASAAITAAE